MTVKEIYKICEHQSIRVKSAYNCKILARKFNPNKHIELGEREITSLWSEIETTESIFGNIAIPVTCVYVRGDKEYYEEHKISKEELK